MKVLDLFSGIGGFSLGLERAGMQTIAFCEINTYCQKILKQHWPDIPVFKDIRDLSADDLPENPELICGGYPCQPFSVAGKQRGKEDNRHLWPEYYRLIREIRPRWLIGENVAGHINMGLDDVLSDLEREGYTWEAFVIPACAINAPHRRDRIWIVGNANGSGFQKKRSEQQAAGFIKSGYVADTQSQRVQRLRTSRQQEPQTHDEKELSLCPGERRFTTHWDAEPAVGRVANGIPARVDRIKALGNAIVPQIPEIIGRAILLNDSEHQRH